MKAGVLENGALLRTEQGTPQGGVVSPILANIYLHEVLDKWFNTTVKPLMDASCSLVRYADDFVMVFETQRDALRVYRALPKRLARFGLQLSPAKTRLLHFPRPWGKDGGNDTFDFLGFTHHWAKSRSGKWVLKRRTAKTRFSRALKRTNEWCRDNRHLAVRDQWQALTRKVRGHFNYFGITGNLAGLERFVNLVRRVWQKWLGRRCSKAHMDWERMNRLIQHYPLPKPKISFRAPTFSKPHT